MGRNVQGTVMKDRSLSLYMLDAYCTLINICFYVTVHTILNYIDVQRVHFYALVVAFK